MLRPLDGGLGATGSDGHWGGGPGALGRGKRVFQRCLRSRKSHWSRGLATNVATGFGLVAILVRGRDALELVGRIGHLVLLLGLRPGEKKLVRAANLTHNRGATDHLAQSRTSL
eukprot:scaffold26293_cov112-Isochrysis_galbana.AAC.4